MRFIELFFVNKRVSKQIGYIPIKPLKLSLIQDVNKWKKYVTEFKIEKVLKFLTTGFFGFYYHYRFYRILGVAAAAGAEVYAEALWSVFNEDF